ncbi:MAG: type 4b pilus protein PilO2 [Rhodobacteraceae bacterium]|nr:type 4b pilus protein PilO2 [Paracoccaceae bacterium]
MVRQNCLQIDNLQAALGLLWQPAQEQIPVREQARMAGGPDGGFDLFVPFAEGKQFGFASTCDGLSAHMLAGASLCGDESWGDNWLAAFAMPGKPHQWWLVAMRDRLVYEDGIHESEDAARAAFLKSRAAPDWDTIVAPPEWQIDDAMPVQLHDAIEVTRAARLRPVQVWPRLIRPAGIVLVLLVILYLGWQAFSDYRERQVRPGKQVVEDIAPPWLSRPNLIDFTRICERNLNHLAIPVPGWQLQTADCDLVNSQASLKLRWQRANGAAAWIKAAVTELAGHEVRIHRDGQIAETGVITALPPTNPEDNRQPLDPDILESLLNDRFLTLGLDIKLTAHPGRTEFRSDGARQVVFGYHDIQIATSGSPSEYAGLLSDIHALVPISLAYLPQSANWILRVRVYHPSR